MGNCLIKNELSKDEIPWFSLDGVVSLCKVISVYDGDTITVSFIFPTGFCKTNGVYKTKCRLADIDTAEIANAESDLEKKFAIETKEYVEKVFKEKNNYVWIKFGKNDKYGRPLGTIFLNEKDMKHEMSFNNHLVEKGYAYTYNGRKKKKFSEWKIGQTNYLK